MRVAFKYSISLHPNCLQDGKYLLDFYHVHPYDMKLNALNHCFWLEYFLKGSITVPKSTLTHLIKPSNTSKAYANAMIAEGLNNFVHGRR